MHRGRDITGRQLMHYRGISLDKNDDGGKTFPKLNELNEEEVEYLFHWLDHYLGFDNCKPVGLLKEFWKVNPHLLVAKK